MKNENDRRSLGNNKAHKKVAAGGRQGVWTDPPQQRRSLRKNDYGQWSLGNNKAHKKAAAGGRQGVQTDPPNSRGHYEK